LQLKINQKYQILEEGRRKKEEGRSRWRGGGWEGLNLKPNTSNLIPNT
jgi:hypothetical protein